MKTISVQMKHTSISVSAMVCLIVILMPSNVHVYVINTQKFEVGQCYGTEWGGGMINKYAIT